MLKLVALRGEGHPSWPAVAHPDDPHYWRREPLAYTSGLLARIEGGLRAPTCRAAVERADGSVALWLEDVHHEPAWTPELLGSVGFLLGRAQAALAADPPDEPWLARGFLRAYLALHRAPDPEVEAVLARLETIPQTLCHNDFHPANVLGEGADVVVDWAYVGPGALGLDAGVLVADGVADGAIAPGHADAAAVSVWDGYASGLHDAGWSGDLRDARWAFLRGTALRLSWLPVSLAALAPSNPLRPAWEATAALLDRWRLEAAELA